MDVKQEFDKQLSDKCLEDSLVLNQKFNRLGRAELSFKS